MTETSPPEAERPDIGSAERPDIDSALARLSDLEALPVEEHVAVYDEIHRRLRDALDGASASGEPAPGA